MNAMTGRRCGVGTMASLGVSWSSTGVNPIKRSHRRTQAKRDRIVLYKLKFSPGGRIHRILRETRMFLAPVRFDEFTVQV